MVVITGARSLPATAKPALSLSTNLGTSTGSTRSTTEASSYRCRRPSVLPALIPGATYRFTDRAANQGLLVRRVVREFTPKGGEALDLGDILIEKPRPGLIE